MLEDFPVCGADYDYAADSVRCRADQLGARVFLLEHTGWRRAIRVLAHSLEDARRFADRLLPPPPDPNAPSRGFAREIQHRMGDATPVDVSAAQERRLVELLARAAHEAASKTNQSAFPNYWDYRKHLQVALLKIVPKHCKDLLAASAVSYTKIKAHNEAEVTRKETRRALARELSNARSRLRQLKRQIAHAEAALLTAATDHCELHQYCLVPEPIIEASRLTEGLPSVSGIYFVWAGGKVVYVGQSVKLSGRCILGSHHAIFPGDMLSWVPEPIPRLDFAEHFYIGILKPERNFGLRARRLVISNQ